MTKIGKAKMKNRTKVIIGGAAAGTLVAGAAAGLGTVLAVRSGLRRFREHRLRELRGKTVLITGGSRGLGLALAEEFAQFGAKIAICARDEQELARARQQLEDLGRCGLRRPLRRDQAGRSG